MDRGGLSQTLSAFEFADLATFADDLPPPDHAAKALRIARKVAARSTRSRTRIATRRASSEAQLAELLPARIDNGDSWHVISGGNIDSMSYAAHIVGPEQIDRMLLSTWCMALDDVLRLERWLAEGPLRWLDCYVGEIFPSQYAATYEALCQAVRKHCQGRVATFRNHSKVMLLRNTATGRSFVVESSANINTNPRTEQTSVTASAALFDFYAAFFDGIKSFNRSFDTWRPYGQAA